MTTATPEVATARIDGRALLLPALVLLLAVATVLYAVAFDQTTVTTAHASGGFLHELFHDARHLLGVPCH